MKPETAEDWKKEAAYLYYELKKMHSKMKEYEHAIYSVVGSTIGASTKETLTEGSWKIYQIENNIKPEDYE